MATRNDVARLAGVSGATVTRVLTNANLVSAATREKVMKAIRELDYHPNYSGQILKGKSTHQILFFCPDMYNPFYVHVYYGMDDYAQKQGYGIILTRHFDREVIQRGRYNGVVLSITDEKRHWEQIEFLNSINLPFVAANFYQASLEMPNVALDYDQASGLTVQHLRDLGHRKLAYISDVSGEDAKWNTILAHIQTDESMRCDKLVLNPAPELYDNLYEAGFLYAERIYRLIQPPTAVIAANDALATGFLSGLSRINVSVPKDLSVISFDDTYMSRFTIPPLTTVHFPKYEMGHALMKTLLSLLENKPYDSAPLASRLIVRGSTTACKDGA